MSNWITGKELRAHWDIEGFELFNCLKRGLQPYTQYGGHKITNTDSLEHAPFFSLEQCITRVRQTNMPTPVESGLRNHRFERFIPMSEREILQEARKQYESQPLKLVNPPSHHMSFTLPLDEKRAWTAIRTVMDLKFKKDEASEFAEKHGFSELNQVHLESPELNLKKWVSGEKIKNKLGIDNANLLNLIIEGALMPHTEGLEPLTIEDMKFMMNDPVGHLSPAWPMAGFDGLRFRKAEVQRFIEGPQPEDVVVDEGEHSTKANSFDRKAKPKAEDIEKTRKEKYPNIVAVINTGQEVQWGDIKVTFLSNEEFLVQWGEENTSRRFNHAGFEDRRNGRPVRSWTTLCKAASRSGEMPFTINNRVQIEKIAQDLNKKLNTLFPDLSEKPIKIFKMDELYKPAFQVCSNL